MPTWLDRSSSYASAVSGASFSPSRSVAGMTNAATDPLPHVQLRDRDHIYTVRAESFISRTLARAASTVAAWTGEAVTASSSQHGTRKDLFVSGESILERGADPDAAADYATGRMLIAASQREYLTATERDTIACAVKAYRYAVRDADKNTTEARANDYAAAHLAGTVATLRGREAVLSEWPGWAGYFAAAEGSRVTPEAAAAFVNGPAPAIVRAAFALGMDAMGMDPIELPSDIGAMVDIGRQHLESVWKKGDIWERAAATIAAMQPPPSDDPTESDADGKDDPQEGTEEGGGTGGGESSTSAGGSIPPESAAEAMTPDSAREGIHAEGRAEPSNPANPGKLHSGMTRYKTETVPLHDPDSGSLDRLRANAAPLIAALRRIAWDSTTPPDMDRAQMRGDLDEGALDRFAAFNDPRVFQTRQESGRSTVAITILIDCSGSMGHYSGADGASRMASAKAVGFALATVFGSSPMHRVRVIGHDVRYAGRGTVMIYDTNGKPDRIASMRSSGDNADGFAIAHAIDLTLGQKADRRAVFLLADGQPSANGYGMAAAAKHIRSEIARGRARGVDFLAIGIDGTMRESGPTLFGSRFVSLENTRGAGPLLARIIGKIGRTPCA